MSSPFQSELDSELSGIQATIINLISPWLHLWYFANNTGYIVACETFVSVRHIICTNHYFDWGLWIQFVNVGFELKSSDGLVGFG